MMSVKDIILYVSLTEDKYHKKITVVSTYMPMKCVSLALRYENK